MWQMLSETQSLESRSLATPPVVPSKTPKKEAHPSIAKP
jgi:hypothetical protein